MTNWPPMQRRGRQVNNEDIAAFEARIGFELPQDYRQFLLEVNGGRTEMSHREFSGTILNRLFSLNDADEESRDLLTRHERALPTLPAPSLLFVGHDDGGARILVSMDDEHRGQVWIQIKEARPDDANPRALWYGRRDMKKVANSFEAFMSSLTPLSD